jgi:hypothetical protein
VCDYELHTLFIFIWTHPSKEEKKKNKLIGKSN